MVDKLHLAIDGEPVGMYVQRTHEDRDHQAFVVKVLVFLSLFYYHDLAVGRRNNQLIRVTVVIADRAAIEVQRHEPGSAKDDDEDPERYGSAE